MDDLTQRCVGKCPVLRDQDGTVALEAQVRLKPQSRVCHNCRLAMYEYGRTARFGDAQTQRRACRNRIGRLPR